MTEFAEEEINKSKNGQRSEQRLGSQLECIRKLKGITDFYLQDICPQVFRKEKCKE